MIAIIKITKIKISIILNFRELVGFNNKTNQNLSNTDYY